MNRIIQMRPREDVVRQIVEDMMDAVLDRNEPISVDELLSAVFTLLQSVCRSTIAKSANEAHTRQVLQDQLAKILLDVVPPLGKAS